MHLFHPAWESFIPIPRPINFELEESNSRPALATIPHVDSRFVHRLLWPIRIRETEMFNVE